MGPSSADELTMDSGHRWPPLTVHRDCAFFRQRIDQEVRAKHNFVLSARPSTSASEKFQMLQQAPALLRLTVGRGQQRLEHLRAARQQERQPQQQHPFAGGGGTPRPAVFRDLSHHPQPASTNATPRRELVPLPPPAREPLPLLPSPRELMPLPPSPRELMPLPPSPRVVLPPRTPSHLDALGQMLSGPGAWHEPPLVMAHAFREPPKVFSRLVEASSFRSGRPAAPLLPWKADFAS